MSAGTRGCDGQRGADLVLLLFGVRSELDHAATVVEECAKSYDASCNDEYLVVALASLEVLADRLGAALSRLREEVGEDVARRADEMVSRFREYRRRLGCA